MKIRFGTKIKGLSESIRGKYSSLAGSPALAKELLDYHKLMVETALRARLISTSKRDPSATPRFNVPFKPVGGGDKVKIIASNIKSKVLTSPLKIVAGSGEIAYMDRKDPLVVWGANRMLKGVRLWRILDEGAEAHEITPRTALYLKFYSERLGQWITTKKVNHPGQSGREFVDKAFRDLNGRGYIHSIRDLLKRMYKRG